MIPVAVLAAVFLVTMRLLLTISLNRPLHTAALAGLAALAFGCQPEGKAWYTSGSDATKPLDYQWPPKLREPYPNLKLVDQNGDLTALSEFKGKVILVELVGMPCSACQAFAGGHERGSFASVVPQKDLESIEKYARRYGGVDLDDGRIVSVQLLLYNMKMQAPTPDEGRAWANHFGMKRSRNEVVLVGNPALVQPASYRMIPGFQFIDKKFILRASSTGRYQGENLYTKFLPMIKQLLAE